MPQTELDEHGFAFAGITWQLPERQYSPVWQSAFAEQPAEQTPPTHALPLAQSADELQVGSGVQVPLLLQPHDLWQSEVWVHAEPGQPSVHSPQGPSASQFSMKQPDRARTGRTNRALEVMVCVLSFLMRKRPHSGRFVATPKKSDQAFFRIAAA